MYDLMTRRHHDGRPAGRRLRCVIALTLSVLAALASPAAARGYVGVGVGIPFYGPPVYAVPPAYYAPPPVYLAPPVYVAPQSYAPPTYAPQGYAPPMPQSQLPPGFIAPPGFNAPSAGMYPGAAPPQNCEAGAYRCPMERPSSPGSSCWCSGNQGQRVYGEVR